ncbi:MAG TPA: hypothetical protein VMF87_01270 [Streptosporangiaceae bacterium]|nr:hypothetical protein [Streptosporangiaceae bacterium]
MPSFKDLDDLRDQLQDKHPGWRVWYVPQAAGITWCAQPTPTLNEASPDDLSKAIRETEDDWHAEGARSA